MDTWNAITDVLSQKWFPALVGTIGGFVGIYSFIDTYIIRFKPKIFVGTKVSITFKMDDNKMFSSTEIDSIASSFEICNHRRKYGVIYDLAVRIYGSDAINPDSRIYFASETSSRLPNVKQEAGDEDIAPFTPVSVLPNTNKSVNVVLSDVEFSKLRHKRADSFHVEYYYQMKPEGKWHFITKLYLYADDEGGEKDSPVRLYTALDLSRSREKLKDKVLSERTYVLEGMTHRFWHYRFRFWTSSLSETLPKRLSEIPRIVPFYARLTAVSLYDQWVRLPLMERYGKKMMRHDIRINNPELRPVTVDALEQLYGHLEDTVTRMNHGADREAVISLSKNREEIILSRYHLSLTIYVGGDTCIRVHETGTNMVSRVNYTLEFKSSFWGLRFWHLENFGFVTVRSFAIKLVDTVILHSHR